MHLRIVNFNIVNATGTALKGLQKYDDLSPSDHYRRCHGCLHKTFVNIWRLSVICSKNSLIETGWAVMKPDSERFDA